MIINNVQNLIFRQLDFAVALYLFSTVSTVLFYSVHSTFRQCPYYFIEFLSDDHMTRNESSLSSIMTRNSSEDEIPERDGRTCRRTDTLAESE